SRSGGGISALSPASSAPRRSCSPAAPRTSLAGQRVQHRLSVTLELHRADALHLGKLGQAVRLARGALAQSRIVEDHVGRNASLGGQLAPNLPQRVEQRIGRTVDAPAARALAWRRYGDGELLLALEDRLRAGPEAEPAIGVGTERVARNQGPRHGTDQRQLFGTGDAENGQTVVAEAAHLLIVVAAEHIGEMADAEPHLGPERGRQEFAGDLGHVERRGRVEAIVAVSAALGRVLAEMAEQDRAAAGRRFDERGERVQAFALARTALRLDFGFDALAGAREILGAPEQPGFRRVAVA